MKTTALHLANIAKSITSQRSLQNQHGLIHNECNSHRPKDPREFFGTSLGSLFHQIKGILAKISKKGVME